MKRKTKGVSGSSGTDDTSQIWVTVYSDMMTNLMLFFLMLWALSRASFDAYLDATLSFEKKIEKREITVVEKKTEPEKDLKEEPKPIPKNFEKIIKPKTNLEGIKIVFNSPILFKIGSSELAPSFKKSLDELAGWLSDVPYTIVVEGYTDNIPIKKGIKYSSNWELSADRSRSVVKYFEEKGIEPKRLVVSGYGENHPMYPNDSEEHRRFNRRIEIYVMYWEK